MQQPRVPTWRRLCGAALAAATALSACTALGEAPGGSAPPAAPAEPASLPGLRLDREARALDLDGTVILREARWIELLACKPGGPEHESILTLDARPSHIHLALLMLGLEPGAPLTAEWEPGQQDVKVTPPHGPRVAVSVLVERDGQRVEVPANEWIVNQKTGQPMTDNTWLFTGSRRSNIEGRSIYHADLNGTIISLVSFGDDVLGRGTTMTNQTDEETWGARTEAIPPIGTKVVVRLRPLEERAARTPATTNVPTHGEPAPPEP